MSEVSEIIRLHSQTYHAEAGASAAEAEDQLARTVDGDGISTLINSALEFRKQGRIDQSIQLITRANRLQLDAIEAIQLKFDKLMDRPPKTIVFTKYRQFHPFEMGIENGDDVLNLLAVFEDELAGDYQELIERLHQLEADKVGEVERLEFFEQRFTDGSEHNMIEEARAAILSLTGQIAGIKKRVILAVLSAVRTALSSFSRPNADALVSYDMSRWLYLLATSPTKTRHASDVRTDT